MSYLANRIVDSKLCFPAIQRLCFYQLETVAGGVRGSLLTPGFISLHPELWKYDPFRVLLSFTSSNICGHITKMTS
jgi:hypothetical protein